MRDTQWTSFFRRAVLTTLALPACGAGSALGTDTSDGGQPQATTPIPTTQCSWQAGPRGTCSWSLQFVGDPTSCAGFASTGTIAQCLAICGRNSEGTGPSQCSIAPVDAGAPDTLYCNVTTGTSCTPQIQPGNGGRRPGYFAALGFGPPPAGRELGTHFARVACMEAGSVEAFRWLRDELIAHGAPKRLVRAAARAIRDEMRHVRQTSALARRFGEEPIAPLQAQLRVVRPLLDMALENAVEGCVRETYSALECVWQSEVATDPVVRATMMRIATDEMRHLALSWQVHSWVKGRLDRAARARVLAAQRAALATLRAEVRDDPHASLTSAGGLPHAHHSQALISAIQEKLAA